MLRRLIDMRMHDGSRHFGSVPETYDVDHPEWYRVRDAVERLDGARLTGFVTDDVTEAWIHFAYADQDFSINNQHGDWWFFVNDPSCPDVALLRVLDHFEAALLPHLARARAAGALAKGSFRAVVSEPDGRFTTRDFADLSAARTYADDAASETENGVVLAWVFDHDLRVVHVGTHY